MAQPETKFKKGGVPWNKGIKNYHVLPPERWARNYAYCRVCKTDVKRGVRRHYARGLCLKCYRHEKNTTVYRDRINFNSSRRWQKIKNDPVLHAEYLEKQKEWRRLPHWRTYFQVKKKVIRYQRYIRVYFATKERPKTLRRFSSGVTLTVEFNQVQYRLPTPVIPMFSQGQGEQKFNFEVQLFKQEVCKFLGKQEEPKKNDGWKGL